VLEAQHDLVELRVGLEVKALRCIDHAGLARRHLDLRAADMEARAATHRQADQPVAVEPVGVDAHAGTPGQPVQRQRPDGQVVHARSQRLAGPDQAQAVRVEDAAADIARLVQVGGVEQPAARELDAGKAAGRRGFVGLG
jgi:hypothetical protein